MASRHLSSDDIGTLVAEAGATGAQGPQGPAGAQGAAGAQGSTGPQGAAGSSGAQGADGAAGAQGASGPQGAQGSAGASDLVYVAAGADTAVNVTADATIVTRNVAGVAAGDQIVADGHFTILNNSGATRVYVLTLDFGGLFDIEFSTGALAASATLMHPFFIRAVLDVRSTSLAYSVVSIEGQLAAGVAAGGDTTMGAASLYGRSWGTTASNATGTLAVALKVRSANATATQTLRLHHLSIRKVTPTA